MASSNGQKDPIGHVPTIDPQALSKSGHNPHQSKRFNAEEWENWMQWDTALDSHIPKSPSNSSNASLPRAGTISHGSTSPSEAESLPQQSLKALYRIPSIDHDDKPALLVDNSARRQPTKKRKTSAQVDGVESRTRQPKGQKISHNVIEKRYRTNLNDKIARLRDSVPVLKTAFQASQKPTSKEGGESGSDDSESDGKASVLGLKFNKATVLTKATEYIEQLEKVNARLLTENSTLRRRVREDTNDVNAPKPLFFRSDEASATGSSLHIPPKVQIETGSIVTPVSPDTVSGRIPVAAEFQRLRAEASDQPSYAPSAPTPEPLSPSPTAPGTESDPCTPAPPPAASELIDFDSVKGSIPVPEYVTRNRIPISQQQHYAPPESRPSMDSADDTFIFDEEPRAWWPRNRASKVLLGSLAGLMIMEGLNANTESPKPKSPHKPPHGKRGMKLLPSEFYTESRGFRAPIRQRIIDFAHSPRGQKALPVIFLALMILTVVFLGIVYWSRNNPKTRRRANSLSSNPEHSLSTESTGSKEAARVPDRLISTFPNSTSVRAWLFYPTERLQVFSYFVLEANLRLRGCWHILTTGQTYAVSREHDVRETLIPRVIAEEVHT